MTTLALRLLDDLGLDPAMVESWTDVDDVYIRAPNGRVLELPLPATAVASLPSQAAPTSMRLWCNEPEPKVPP
ncbi:MAG: hypothetical protein R2770_15125 [Acidimicrobiales bacterium]